MSAAAKVLLDAIRHDRRDVMMFLTDMVRVGQIGAGDIVALTIGAIGQADAFHIDTIESVAEILHDRLEARFPRSMEEAVAS